MERSPLARRIRAFRKLKGYTQQEFAVKLEIPVNWLGNIERGSKLPDEQLIERIACILEIDVAELLVSREEVLADA